MKLVRTLTEATFGNLDSLVDALREQYPEIPEEVLLAEAWKAGLVWLGQ